MSDYESKLISCTFRKMTTDICRSYNHLAKKNVLFEFKNPYVGGLKMSKNHLKWMISLISTETKPRTLQVIQQKFPNFELSLENSDCTNHPEP